jgi:hypothetical protein
MRTTIVDLKGSGRESGDATPEPLQPVRGVVPRRIG